MAWSFPWLPWAVPPCFFEETVVLAAAELPVSYTNWVSLPSLLVFCYEVVLMGAAGFEADRRELELWNANVSKL